MASATFKAARLALPRVTVAVPVMLAIWPIELSSAADAPWVAAPAF
jgi:hypothetical protein